jgi:hypothetical protein
MIKTATQMKKETPSGFFQVNRSKAQAAINAAIQNRHVKRGIDTSD